MAPRRSTSKNSPVRYKKLLTVLLFAGSIACCIPCYAADDNPESLAPFLHGTVFEKEKGQPLADALVILARKNTHPDNFPYEVVTSVVTDADGQFLFADPQLWQEKNVTLLVWKRSYSWATRELSATFYSSTKKEPQNVYVARLPYPVPRAKPVQVFYATDRAPSQGTPLQFLNDRDPNRPTHYGLCNAAVEPPSNGDPVAVDKGFVNGLQPYYSLNDEFSAALSADHANVLLFIHGFDTSFEQACATAAQVAYDTDFRGVVFIFSWPSADEITIAKYHADERIVAWSSPHFTDFLAALSSRAGPNVEILAHSMGNRALLGALISPGLRQHHLDNIVFAAPDVDSGDFRNDIGSGINAQRATLYASSHDMALAASKVLHWLQKRAGDADPEIDTANHLDSIDASLVATGLIGLRSDDRTGHSYYRTSWSVLADLSSVFRNEPTPGHRQLGHRTTRAHNPYWALVP